MNRATTLSTLTLLTNIPYALSAIWIGGYIDRTSPNQFAWMLGLFILFALVGAFFVREYQRRTDDQINGYSDKN